MSKELSLKTDRIRILFSMDTKECLVASVDEFDRIPDDVYKRLDYWYGTEPEDKNKNTLEYFRRQMMLPLMIGVPFFVLHTQCLRVKEYKAAHVWEFGGTMPDGTFDGCYQKHFKQWVEYNDPNSELNRRLKK